MHARVLTLIVAVLLNAPVAAESPTSQSARSLAATCAACHGTEGLSDIPGTPALAGLQRDFILTRLNAFREPSYKGDAMHHLAHGYTAEQAELIAGYFSSLHKEDK